MTLFIVLLSISVILYILGYIFMKNWVVILSFIFFFCSIFIPLIIHDKDKKPQYHSDYGIVVGKEAEPAGMGLNMWTLKFQYMPDRYKLILNMEDGRRKEMSIDAVGYMQTNIGDRVKYRY